MKTLLTAIGVIAVANLIALLGFAGWLASTGRVDRARMNKVREMFSETVASQTAREAAEVAQAEADAKTAEQAKKDARPPITASEQLSARVEATEIDRQRAERLRREIADLQRSLAERETQVNKRAAEIDKDKTAFEKMRAGIAASEASAQFKKTLSTLEGLKPAEAKKTLKEVLSGDPVKGIDQVVSYLNAMEDRARTKVMAEFIKEDPKLAADLLERLRMRGTEVPPQMESLANAPVGSDK
jgi:hypothetical protein